MESMKKPKNRNRTNKTPYLEMFERHEHFKTEPDPPKDGKKDGLFVRSGKKFYVIGYEPFYVELPRVDENDTGEHTEIIEYRHYKIVDSSRKMIGTITRFTPLERAYSIINRYESPNHMKPGEFIAYVRHSGKADGEPSERMPYVTIPNAYADYYDVLVDDPVAVRIMTKDGHAYSTERHVSRMKDGLIVSLSEIRNDVLTITDPVHVAMDPLPQWQNFDLSTRAVQIMKSFEVEKPSE